MIFILGILAGALIFYDCRDRSVPTFLLGIFGVILLWQALAAPQWISAVFGFLLVVSICVMEYVAKQLFLGGADKVLLPGVLLMVPLINLGDYLICVGAIGVCLAFLWRRFGGQKSFPFLPALLLPLLWCAPNLFKSIDFSFINGHNM